MKRIGVIIPAAGTGSRMAAAGTGVGTSAGVAGDGARVADGDGASAADGDGASAADGDGASAADAPKQFMLLGGEPVLAHVIRAFRSVVRDADIVVALAGERLDEWAGLCLDHDVPPHKICEGGASRFHSVRNALGELDPDVDYIAVHDAARPLVSAELILRTIEVARRHGTAIPVVELTDSIRRIRNKEEGLLPESSSRPEERSLLRAVQTPQVFRADILRTGYERATGEDFTDDAGVVESVGYNVMLCAGERRNMKLTEPADMIMAEALTDKK